MQPIRLAAVLALVLSGLLAGMAAAETVVVRNDGGGNINDYQARRAQLARADAVRIQGKCLSACVIFTTLPNACVMPGARIGFHGTTPKLGIPAIDLWLDMRMGQYFRGEVRRRFINEWRHLAGSDQIHIVTGRQLKKLDPQVRLCRVQPKNP